ncbi:hypothetical protein RUM43_004708 [Polyplax serrata]|uniref:Myb-like domain-containing protein n=1 Tax=Polyplax serrata TaxID=468196 RepID=A0AAN8SCG3_POLSC
MTSTESLQVVKKVNDAAKKSPLKVVSPILKKYTGHRQGKIKNKLKFPRVLHGGRTKQSPIKPQLKTILPKTNAGNVIILEPDLLPCALNLLKRKRKEDENGSDCCSEQIEIEINTSEGIQQKECNIKGTKPKLLPNNKKKVKCMKNLEASLELLDLNNDTLKEKKEQAFAENYLMRVQQRLKEKEESLYHQFLDLICDFQVNQISVCDLYRKVKSLFICHTDLTEDFVAFLTPEQAVECGVFMEHLLLTSMSDFLNMIDIYFAKSPQQIKKIHSVLESLASQPNVNTEAVVNTVLPLLKGNPVLKDYFIHLLPDTRPPDNFCIDYEEVEYSELNSDVSDDEDNVEMIHLPEVEDHYGGDLCPCNCHNEKKKELGEHCVSCSLKFINGKVFLQNGKLLRPARVVFDDYDLDYHRERLAPKLYPKRNKKKQRHGMFKDNVSPTKSCNLSSDEFKSDIEEDDRGRIKFLSCKSPRANRKKSVSPKHCDKAASRCILLEPKSDLFDYCEEKPKESPKEEEKPLKVDVDSPQSLQKKTEQIELTIISQENTLKDQEEGEVPAKPLDLPKIDVEEETGETEKQLPVLDDLHPTASPPVPVASELPPVAEKERSHSPPVLSIPETANSIFANSKPILSLLETLDESKNSGLHLVNADAGQELSSSEVKATSVKVEGDVKEANEESDEMETPWKIEEDRVILQTLQVEENCEETFMKIGKSIPRRSVKDIKNRFAELMNILYEMKTKTGGR